MVKSSGPGRLDAEGLWTDSKGSITLASGDRMCPTSCTSRDIHISDIAHSLARQCRYNGHVGGYLSVARHSLWVAHQVSKAGVDGDIGQFKPASPQLIMTGLLHDAAEAYLGDMIRPLKHDVLGEHYLEVERGVEVTIASRFDLPFPFPPEIKAADNYVLLQRELGGEKARWTWTSTPDEDEQAFLLLYRKLTGERRAQ